MDKVDLFLKRVAPFGIVGYGVVLILLLAAYLPGYNHSGGLDDSLDFLSDWFWMVLAIFIFVPLNLWVSFPKRRYAIIGYFAVVGTSIAFLFFDQALDSLANCKAYPQYVYCTTYNYFFSGIFLPAAIFLGAATITILTYFSSLFARFVDFFQRILVSVTAPFVLMLFVVILVVSPYSPAFPFSIIIFLLAWILTIVLLRKRRNDVMPGNTNSPNADATKHNLTGNISFSINAFFVLQLFLILLVTVVVTLINAHANSNIIETTADKREGLQLWVQDNIKVPAEASYREPSYRSQSDLDLADLDIHWDDAHFEIDHFPNAENGETLNIYLTFIVSREEWKSMRDIAFGIPDPDDPKYLKLNRLALNVVEKYTSNEDLLRTLESDYLSIKKYGLSRTEENRFYYGRGTDPVDTGGLQSVYIQFDHNEAPVRLWEKAKGENGAIGKLTWIYKLNLMGERYARQQAINDVVEDKTLKRTLWVLAPEVFFPPLFVASFLTFGILWRTFVSLGVKNISSFMALLLTLAFLALFIGTKFVLFKFLLEGLGPP